MVAALADGTLPAERRAEVMRRIAASAALAETFRRQLEVVTAVRAVQTAAPSRLRARIEAEHQRRGSRLIRRPAIASGLASVAAATAALVLVLGLPLSDGGGNPPAVTDVAAMGVRGPLSLAVAPDPHRPALLRRTAAGLPFPNLEAKFGWTAAGVRTGSVEGRPATTVLYEKDGRRIAYTIVAGPPLASATESQRMVRDGVGFELLARDGAQVVTWLRRGHTCVLSGPGTRAQELLALASWTGKGTIPS